MNQKEGYQFAIDNNLIDKKERDFYKLFKCICRLESITAIEKIIFTIIVSYTERGSEFHMSNAQLSIECGLDASNVSKKISVLKEKGFIKTYKVYDKKNGSLVGRVIEPQMEFLNSEIEKNWNKYIYKEY